MPVDASAELAAAFATVMESITYADRNGSSETAGLEESVASGLDRLSLSAESESQDIAALSEIQNRLEERRDLLKATR
jgi:hypothetical protein